jgi:hypothetical protein
MARMVSSSLDSSFSVVEDGLDFESESPLMKDADRHLRLGQNIFPEMNHQD